MADSSPSYSQQENDFGTFEFLSIPPDTSDSYSFSPALSQVQSTTAEFGPPSHPYDLHTQQTEVFDWASESFMVDPEPTPSYFSSEQLSQNTQKLNMPQQSTQRFQIMPGFHQAQHKAAMLQRAETSPRDRQINRYLESLVVPPNPAVIKHPSENLPHVARMKKEQQEMDDDERLLASEEGKKLTSRERRQLRNKVSARAFRSRRKEYITQLESEVQKKTYETEVAKDQVSRLQQEVEQLRNLTRTLLRHDAFQTLLQDMTTPLFDAQATAAQQPAEDTADLTSTITPASVQMNSAPKLAWGQWEQPNPLNQRPNVF